MLPLSSFALSLLVQVAAPGGAVAPPAPRPAARPVRPVLEFPEAGIDDTAKYRGYRTRFYRDAAGNTLQVYLDAREGRVVHLWADAENESIGFTARDGRDSVATLDWGGAEATVGRRGRARTLEYQVEAPGGTVRLGHWLLGTMRVERDFQYWQKHRQPLGAPAFTLDEMSRLLATLGALEPAERTRHLAALNARDTATLRRRLHPRLSSTGTSTRWTARVVQPSLDGRDTMTVEIVADPRRIDARQAGDTVTLRARDGGRVRFTVRVGTTGRALTSLTRQQIFTPAFLRALAAAGDGRTSDRDRRRLERQVTGVELLSSREKLMAGLPTYATYFGRDMLVSALMMQDIWRPDMAAFAVGAALRKLSPTGQVSHEEALGGQAVREAASEYVELVAARDAARSRGDRAAADSLGARALRVLRESRRTRENYHMIDDELQLPILAARWLADSSVSDARKRAFLDDSSDGRAQGARVVRLVKELALVARMTAPYAAEATAANLIAFAPRDSGRWASTSWRDSGVGYANGKYAMDVNAIWAPHALEATLRITGWLSALGYRGDALVRRAGLAADEPLARWMRDDRPLRAAIDTWRGAERHFVVRLGRDSLWAGIGRRLAAMPAVERDWWTQRLASQRAAADSLTFLALALDADARPIGVANSDVATRLFLGPTPGTTDSAARAAAMRDVRLFALEYPVGLLVENVGPVVANDAWAPPAVWDMFVKDRYHSPRVAWGREVNLFQLGVAKEIEREMRAGPGRRGEAATARVEQLRDALAKVRAAVAASGFGSELWSYEFVDGRPHAVRYGSGADVQLWSTTDLAVWYALHGTRDAAGGTR